MIVLWNWEENNFRKVLQMYYDDWRYLNNQEQKGGGFVYSL